MKTNLLKDILTITKYGLSVVLLQCMLFSFVSAKEVNATEKNSADISISGKITDENNQGLPGAGILVEGTGNGTVTDLEGNYKLDVPSSETVLVISFVGYKTQEITVGARTTIDISMEVDATALEEVVVVGYGEVNKRDLTGAIGQVKSVDIVRANPVQAAQALQGQVAGVNINKIKGRPGDGYDIQIRGISNFDEDGEGLNDPLIVIDGVLGGDINSLNPADIASMDVLKDASSAAIYGSRGANGVIIITTHKGTSGKPKVSYNAYVGTKTPAHIPRMMNAQEFYEAYRTDGTQDQTSFALGGNAVGGRDFTDTEIANAESGKSVDWLDLVTGPALQTSHTFTVTGGNDKTTYNFSAGYLQEGGNTLFSGFDRYTVNAGLESQIHDKVKVGFTSYYSYSLQNLSTTEAIRSSFRARPTGTVHYDDVLEQDLSKEVEWNGYAVWMGINDSQVLNPLVEIDPENHRHERRTSNILANGFVEYEPIKGLSFRTSVSTTVKNFRDGQYYGNYSKQQRGSRGNKAQYRTRMDASYTIDNILTYKLNSGDHNLNVTALQSTFRERREDSFIAAGNLPYRSLWYQLSTGADNITAFETDLTERSILSYMGRINYIFKDKYLLTVTGRSDGASVLSEGNKWIFYPSVALSWRMGDEDFIKNTNLFSDLKLRVSYGEVGNASTVRPYQTQALISSTQYEFDGTNANGFGVGQLANKALLYEKSKELNLGLNIGVLDNRITAVIELYNRKTVDLILPDKVPTSTGFEDVIANVGEIQNKGIEITLNTVNIAKPDFKWTSSLTITRNKDEVTKLAGGILQDIGNNRFVGESVRPHFTYKFDGIWQLDEAAQAAEYGQTPGHVRLVDLNEDGEITPDDRMIVGKETPDLLLGLRNKINYKNFDFSFFIYTRRGQMINNQYLRATYGDIGSDRYNRSAELNFWTPDNPSNEYFGLLNAGLNNNPRIDRGGQTRVALQHQMANFVRISDITFGYTFPASALDKLGLTYFRLYAQAQNPFLFTDILTMNPEYNSGGNDDDIPFATYSVGLNLSF